MSLPVFTTQAELFSTAGLSGCLFGPTDRYRLFAQRVFPVLARTRSQLEACYCADNGRVALEPVLLLGVSLFQYLEGIPDRQAVELLRYHAGWNFALSKMNRLDCVRESLRLALQEVEQGWVQGARPAWWASLWERYVESQADYRTDGETLTRKLVEAGTDAQRLLAWLSEQPKGPAQGEPVGLLARVFGEQFEVRVGSAAPQPRSKEPVDTVSASVLPPSSEQKPASQVPEAGTVVEPKGKGQFASDRVQNPHDPDATYAVKGQGEKKKEHVGYKVQVAETVCEATLAPGEPTRNFIVGMVTHPAYQSDEAGDLQMEAEQRAMGLEKPPVHYVDGAYVSAQKLVEAQGRELIGPAQPARQKDGRFTAEDFQIQVEERTAICPAGKTNTQCSRLEQESDGKVSYRFEFSTQCHDCPLRERCLGKDQRHRALVVGEHHTALPGNCRAV